MSPLRYTIRGRLTECVQLAFRTPRDHVRKLIPRGFKLLTHEGFAFWSVCISRTEGIRPAGIPPFMSVTCHHVSYRLLVRVPVSGGKELRGSYFIRSDTDNSLVCTGGNILTDFHFHRSRIALKREDSLLDITVEDPRGVAEGYMIGEITDECVLTPDSCFADEDEAHRVLKLHPRGLSLDKGGRVVDIAEMQRDDKAMKEHPIRVGRWGFTFLRHMDQPEAHLETGNWLEPLDYSWRLGETALLN